jgi:hypothetical protein
VHWHRNFTAQKTMGKGVKIVDEATGAVNNYLLRIGHAAMHAPIAAIAVSISMPQNLNVSRRSSLSRSNIGPPNFESHRIAPRHFSQLDYCNDR